MMYQKNTCPEEIQLSYLLDGNISSLEANKIYQHIHECVTCFEKYQQLEKVSSFIHQSCTTQLTPNEKKHFIVALNNRILAQNAQKTRYQDWPSRSFALFNLISWQWKTAAALIMLLFLSLPFIVQKEQTTSDYFMPPLISDFSEAKITVETDPASGYDLIWVVTEEEEKKDSSGSPIGFSPYPIV